MIGSIYFLIRRIRYGTGDPIFRGEAAESSGRATLTVRIRQLTPYALFERGRCDHSQLPAQPAETKNTILRFFKFIRKRN